MLLVVINMKTVVTALVLFVYSCKANLECSLPSALREEIHSYQSVVDRIIDSIYNGPYSGVLYSDLADYADTFGHRQAGSQNLENAIDGVIKRQEEAGLVVSTHDVEVPLWIRGEASADIISPRRQALSLLTLGFSTSTPVEGITAEVMVVKDFDELEARKAEVPGKIVVYDAEYITYGQSNIYRGYGPDRASRLGAVAALVRSTAPFSINSPHTGFTLFTNESFRIPAASITVENSKLISRLINSGKNVTINFKSTARNEASVISRNVIGDILGVSKPQEYVTISGHLDSWDVGQGVLDDAGGCFLAWHSLALINYLGLDPPARTLRSVMWTAEETGVMGAAAYRAEREDELRNWTAAFESDVGIYESSGIGFSGTDDATCILLEIASMLSAVNGTQVVQQEAAGSDITLFQDLQVPLGEPLLKPNNYFWFHHSEGDWMDVLKTEDLDQNLAIFASTVYILGNLSIPLPKGPPSFPNSTKLLDLNNNIYN